MAYGSDDDLRATLDSDTFPRDYALPLHIGQAIIAKSPKNQVLCLSITAQLLQPLQVKPCGLGAVFNPQFAQHLAGVAFDGGFT